MLVVVVEVRIEVELPTFDIRLGLPFVNKEYEPSPATRIIP